MVQNFQMPTREQNSNKGTFGKVLNFAGSRNYIGASYLSTIAPLKVGAGFAALATEPDIIHSVSTLLPEAVYLTREEGLEKMDEFSVILIGCGLGLDKKSFDLFENVIAKIQNRQTPLIVDADGLNILSKNKIELPPNTIITPHPLEASRLLNIDLEDVLSDIEGSAKKLSEKYNCVAVLKTHRTIVCQRDKIYKNEHGNSALAKAGSGDVLAGIIAGLVAQKMDLFEAAKLGVYLHSRCGEIASQELTEYSVLASDLPKYIHLAIKEILNDR